VLFREAVEHVLFVAQDSPTWRGLASIAPVMLKPRVDSTGIEL